VLLAKPNHLLLNFQDWQEKMAFQKQIIPYFTDVQKSIAPVLRTMSPAEVVNNIYRMTGYLIKYCAKLLYVQVGGIVLLIIIIYFLQGGLFKCLDWYFE
jgi:hypothetical protein